MIPILFHFRIERDRERERERGRVSVLVHYTIYIIPYCTLQHTTSTHTDAHYTHYTHTAHTLRHTTHTTAQYTIPVPFPSVPPQITRVEAEKVTEETQTSRLPTEPPKQQHFRLGLLPRIRVSVDDLGIKKEKK